MACRPCECVSTFGGIFDKWKVDVMTFWFFALSLVPSILSVCVSGVYAYVALRKLQKPPKDEIWETATKLVSPSSVASGMGADDFAQIYMELKFFKDNGYTLNGEYDIHAAMTKGKAGKQ